MNDDIQMPDIDFSVNKENLFREETILDLRAASIKVLTPVNLDGTVDENRKKIYVGNTSLMSPQGPVPLQAQLDASTLEEALDRFPDAMKEATEQMIQRVKEMQQQAQKQEDSRIVVPGR